MKYWKYSPGRGACYWDYCRSHSLIAIGWSRAGDLSQYANLSQLAAAFEREGWASGMWNTGDTQLWNFRVHCVRNDIIIAYKRGFILSVGKVDSDYYYDEENIIDEEWEVGYSHRRDVNWLPRTRKDIINDGILYGNPPDNYGTLNKQLTFYEITDNYTINIINKLISR